MKTGEGLGLRIKKEDNLQTNLPYFFIHSCIFLAIRSLFQQSIILSGHDVWKLLKAQIPQGPDLTDCKIPYQYSILETFEAHDM